MTQNSSRSQFNSSNYMPLKFGLRSRCMVCAFGKRRRGNTVGSGARESAENVGWFWLRVGSQCALPLSPLMQGSVFLCLAVLFSSGDLEVSNSAIQIHCVRFILSSNPPISPLLLTFSCLPAPHFFPQFFTPRPSSRLVFLLPRSRLRLFSLISCLILFVLFSPALPPLFLSYLITSSQAAMFFSHSFPLLFFVTLPLPFSSCSL